MVSLTTQHRDILRHLVTADGPIAAGDIARRMGLTPRQVRYRLKTTEVWLAERNAATKSVPGVGIMLDCSSSERSDLMRQLDAEFEFDLVLSPGQRRQLFSFRLLTADEPLTLRQLQKAARVAHTTVFNDLAPIEAWLESLDLTLARRRNYGLLVEGTELARRQALAALAWGDAPFEDPLTQMTYHRGLVFSMSDCAPLLPIIQSVEDQTTAWDTRLALEWVASAEAQLEGRFTDDVVLHLALAFAIQVQRVKGGRLMTCQASDLDWLRSRYVWNVAVDLSQRMGADVEPRWPTDEVAAVAMHLLAGSRSELWPRDLYPNGPLDDLVDSLMDEAAQAFRAPELRRDASLRDGLLAHLVPAVMRQRFGLWAPAPLSGSDLPPAFRREHAIARQLAEQVFERTGFNLPQGEVYNLALLLRAAFIRERPDHPPRVFVVCPSGMATAQLVVARLTARFPHLEVVGVLSIREISRERVADAQLIISTAPVEPPAPWIDVIQVHPLLTSDDVEAITRWLT